MTFHSRRQLRAELLLMLVTLFWGLTFPLMKSAFEETPVLSFLWQRFALAGLVLLPFAWGPLRRLSLDGWRKGLVLGLLLFLSFLFQTLGLKDTSASNAGFITGLCTLWVPLLAVGLLRRPPGSGSLIGVVLAMLGLFLLTHPGQGAGPWHLASGDLWVLLSSVFIALHIIGLDTLARGHDGRALTLVQIGLMAGLALGASAFYDAEVLPASYSGELIQALIVTAVLATALAFWVQTAFQRHTTPTRAALIYLLEPLFAALFSVWLLSETLSPLAWLGGGLILAGMLCAELWPRPEAVPTDQPENLQL